MLKKFLNSNLGGMLVSLLVSFGIIIILITISIPYIRKFQPNLKLNAAVRDLTTDMRYAQQLTITEQVPHLVELDEINNKYRLLKIDIATTTLKTVSFPVEVFYQSVTGFTNNLVRFNSYGGVSEQGEIVIINTNNNTRKINVKPSGYIQLE